MITRIISVCAIALALAACGGAGAGQAPTLPGGAAAGGAVIAAESRLLESSEAAVFPDVGQAAPEFQYTLPDGTVQKLSDLRGKKVIINFWATWCEPCRDEMPALQEAYETYGDEVVVLGVNKAENATQVAAFAAELNLKFPLVVNSSADIADQYWAKNIPLTYFVNTDGTIGYRKLGPMDFDFVKQQLDQLS